MSYSIVGSAKPVWLRAVMVREGNDVVTRCCVVAEGQFFPIEVRVNVPKLIATLRAMGLDESTMGDQVGGFGSWLKKAVKTVTKSKVVKAVSKVVSKVVKNPVVQAFNPALAISAHTISKAATGKGVIKGKLGAAVDLGTAVVTKVAPIPSAMSFVSPKAAAALGVGMKAVLAAKAGPMIATAARMAQGQVRLGNTAAQAILKKTVDPKKAAPLVKRAVAIKSNITKIAPQLAAQVTNSAKVKAQFASIAAKAKAGSADAQLASKVIAKSAQTLDQIARLQAQSAGGLPGLLVTATGRIVRAPKGRFMLKSSTPARPDVLYRGPKEPTLKGSFAAVAGSWNALVGHHPEWGGAGDPGQEIEGPYRPLCHPGGNWALDDYSQVAGALTP